MHLYLHCSLGIPPLYSNVSVYHQIITAIADCLCHVKCTVSIFCHPPPASVRTFPAIIFPSPKFERELHDLGEAHELFIE